MSDPAWVDGLAVDRLGDPSGPTVVIVHGTMDRAASFRRAVRKLPDHDVVLFDRRGYARSRGAGSSPDIASQVADLLAVVDWTGADDICLVGHSLGALLSFHASLAAPEVVTCIGAWEPPLPWREEYSSALRDRPSVLGHLEDPEAAAEAFLRSMVGDRLWDRMPSAMRAERRAEGVALVADLRMCRRPEAEIDFHAVVRPTLLGCGAASAERFRWSARHLLEALPDAMLVEVAESEHGAHLSHPAEFAAFAAAARARGARLSPAPQGEG